MLKIRFSKKWCPLLFVVLLVGLDQMSKAAAVYLLMNQQDVILIPGVLQLSYVQNTGAAFSMLAGRPWFFLILTPVLIALILCFYFKMPPKKRYLPIRILLLFLLSGAVGNYIDRIAQGYVVDFIYFSLIHFPVFNVADIYVTVSVALLILLMIFRYRDDFSEDEKEDFPQETEPEA